MPKNLKRKRKSKQLLLITFLFPTLLGFAQTDSLSFYEDFGVQLITKSNEHFEGTYKVTYQDPIQTEALLKYLKTLQTEMGKYPSHYFNTIEVKRIVIGSGLHLDEQLRAAIPSNENATLYLNFDTSYPLDYQVNTFHHELHHLAEFAAWESFYHHWKKWCRKNKKSFSYGDGGLSAYENLTIDWNAEGTPGFTSLYSTTSEEEDRCELASVLMNLSTSSYFQTKLQSDKVLRKKVKLIKRFWKKLGFRYFD